MCRREIRILLQVRVPHRTLCQGYDPTQVHGSRQSIRCSAAVQPEAALPWNRWWSV